MSWLDLLLPASFNGVPFLVESTERNSGRRRVDSEFPLRDDPSIEDLGRLKRSFTLKVYFAGDLYMFERAALEAVLDASDTVGTLIHPTYGKLSVWVGTVRSSESRAVGGYATMDIDFALDGGTASPLSVTDTSSALLSGLNDLVPYLQAAYVAAVGVTVFSSAVAAVLSGNLTAAWAAFGQLPLGTISGIAASFAADVSDGVATAGAVIGAFDAAAANVVAAQPAQALVYSPVSGTVPMVTAADPSGGLAGLAAFGTDVAPLPATAPPAVVAAQAAVITLVQGAALTAVLTVYGQLQWQSYNQAATAAEALQRLLDAQVAAAADAGNFDLFRAWRAISAQAMADMTLRAQNLPSLAAYSMPASMPALALAQLLYQDSTQADALVALNDVPHPIFMPAAGSWLEPV